MLQAELAQKNVLQEKDNKELTSLLLRKLKPYNVNNEDQYRMLTKI